MRIAFFTESLPPLIDGVSHTLGYLQKYLSEKDIEYRFYSPFEPDDRQWDGRVYRMLSVPFPLYRKYRVSLPAFHDLAHSLDKFKPDLIHICSPILLGLFARRYARRRRIPLVSSFHTRFVSYLKYYGFGWFEKYGWSYLKWFYNGGDLSMVPSMTTIRELEERGFLNLRLWSRGVDLHRFSPGYADRNLKLRWSPSGKPIALFTGRLVKEKDIDILLKAHAILRERNIEYQLVFVGEGPMRKQIEKEAPDAVIAGHLDGDELSRAYASSDLFAFPSTTESFGNVVLEAAASGLPVIGASEGGVTELVREEETGFLVRPGAALEYAERMERLLTDPILRLSMSAASVEFASSRSWDSINGQLVEQYRALIEDTKSPHLTGVARLK